VKEPYEVIGRIIAEENETVQIINGLLYINNKYNDTMKYSYLFKVSNLEVEGKLTEYQKKYKLFNISDDSILLNASYNELRSLNLKRIVPREIDTFRIKDIVYHSIFNPEWASDNFVPIFVPKDSCFLLGDNRSMAADSRFRRFVHEDDIVVKYYSEINSVECTQK